MNILKKAFKAYKKINIIRRKTILYLFALGKQTKRNVMFESFEGRSYSDNPRAISEKLHDLDPHIEIVWVLNQPDNYGIVPSYVRVVSRFSHQYKSDFVSCGCYITNEVLDPWVIKKPDQLFIQTWHGDKAFKKVLYDAWIDRKRPEPVLDEKYTDICVAGSEYGVKQFRSAFNYKGEILNIGTPRNDCLINMDNERISNVKNKLNISDDICCLLYAPTFRMESTREKNAQSIQGIDILSTLKLCEKQYGGHWICLLRGHPLSLGLKGYENREEILDVTQYPDMADLLLIADCLITDYSSCAGDFALKYKPIFLFQDDLDYYTNNERGFYFDINKSPYITARSQEELEKEISNSSYEKAAQNCASILEFYKNTETGDSAKEIADRVISWLNRRQYNE